MPSERKHAFLFFATERRCLALLAALAFCLRFAAIAHFTGLHTAPASGTDEAEYQTYAWNVAQGHGYRGPSPDVADPNHLTAYRPPAPSLYYAAVYFLCGHRYAAAHLANCLLAALTVLLLYGITSVCFGKAAARIAAIVYAFYPLAIYFNLTLLSETFASCLVCLLVACCLGLRRPRGRLWALGAGLTLGLLILSKPGYALVLPLLPFWAWLVCGKQRELWLRAVLVPLVALLTLAPWIARNEIVLGAFIPFSTMGGSSLLQTNNRLVVSDPRLYGYGTWDTFLPEYAPALHSAGDEVTRDARAQRFAVQWLRANPDKWFYLLRGKFLRLWTPQLYGEQAGGLQKVISLYYGVILLFFLAALVPVTRLFLREKSPALIMHALLLANTGTALVTYGMPRYRLPTDSLCISIGAFGAAWLCRTVAERSHRAAFAALIAFLRGHRRALAMSGGLFVGLVVWTRSDMRRMEAYRDAEARQRLTAIRQAVAAYRTAQGRLPARLADLVPNYLPNVESLHCPKDSLRYDEYRLLGSQDVRAAANLISYELVRSSDSEPEIAIRAVENRRIAKGNVRN